MKNQTDYSKYECPYSHLNKACGHELHGPEGYQDTYSVWCPCGFRGPVFYIDPKELKLKKLDLNKVVEDGQAKCPGTKKCDFIKERGCGRYCDFYPPAR